MTDLLLNLNPGLIVILAGMLCAVLPASQIRKLLVLAAPIAGIISISMLYTDQEVILGVRFGEYTKYALIDIDINSATRRRGIWRLTPGSRNQLQSTGRHRGTR